VVAILLASVACGREGAEDDGRLTEATSSPSPATSATPGPSGTTAPTASSAVAVDGTAGPRARTAAPVATVKPSDGPVQPARGSYRFNEKGTRRAGSTGQDQPYEQDGTLTVSASSARSTLHFETEQGSEEMTLRFERDRVLLERARIEQSIATFDAKFDPPQMVVRTPLRVGDAWTNTWKAGGTSGTTKIRVDREETVQAFGRSWRAFVIVNSTTASGDAKGTTTSTSWYVRELGLDVKRISDFEGSYQGVPFKQYSERILTSRP
jgi:hypothetical protein